MIHMRKTAFFGMREAEDTNTKIGKRVETW